MHTERIAFKTIIEHQMPVAAGIELMNHALQRLQQYASDHEIEIIAQTIKIHHWTEYAGSAPIGTGVGIEAEAIRRTMSPPRIDITEK